VAGWRHGRGIGVLLYRVGAPLDVVLGPCPVAVAGARDPTPEGGRLAREVGRRLAEGGYSVPASRGALTKAQPSARWRPEDVWRRFCLTS